MGCYWINYHCPLVCLSTLSVVWEYQAQSVPVVYWAVCSSFSLMCKCWKLGSLKYDSHSDLPLLHLWIKPSQLLQSVLGVEREITNNCVTLAIQYLIPVAYWGDRVKVVCHKRPLKGINISSNLHFQMYFWCNMTSVVLVSCKTNLKSVPIFV